MKILFIGTVELSKNALQKLIDLNAHLVGVCTSEKSVFNADHFDLTPLCIKNNIPVINVKDINSKKSIHWIRSKEPDIIFCFGWSYLLKKELLNIPPMGILGFHPAELPKNRGRHPLIWALILGLKQTASTFYFMDDSADGGDILSQHEIPILDSDNAKNLYQKMISVSLKQIEFFLPDLVSGNFVRTPQDNSKASYWRKRSFDDGKIDWRMTASSINNLVRGLSKPYVGCHFEFDDQIIKVWESKIVLNNNKNIEPGKVISIDKKGIIVKAGKDSIRLIKIEPEITIPLGRYL
tara:strand:+ start:3945 stop:4826 length:882 start_codon:yes stop_codon:yes gene_type:complete